MSATASGVAQTAIDVTLAAIFVSLELSRSSWVVTSLSPGKGEKMSKHSVRSGDVTGLLNHFAKLRAKAQARTGKSFPIVAIYEAGLDGFWIHRVLGRLCCTDRDRASPGSRHHQWAQLGYGTAGSNLGREPSSRPPCPPRAPCSACSPP